MTVFVFDVPGEPMSKARARVVNGHAYTPPATVAAEARVLTAYLKHAESLKAREGPLRVDCTFYAATKIRRDLDNLLKLCLDALNGCAWVDDCQIQELLGHRRYVAKGEARTVIAITELCTNAKETP